jgi:glucose-1-phosphate cytidylyltransferase
VNGGFFVLERKAIDYIATDATTWEREPMDQLSAEGELMAWRHDGFWQSMDSLRDRHLLEELWSAGNPPWRIWRD